MDILVLLDECDDDLAPRAPATTAADARLVAYVHSSPDALAWAGGRERRGAARPRDVVTLCGAVDADLLALALAAAVEGRRDESGPAAGVRHLGVWAGGGAAGDRAWRDPATGQLMSQDVAIAAGVLEATAHRLLADAGRLIRQTAAELSTPEWPEGARRAISFVLPVPGDMWAGRTRAAAGLPDDLLLATIRESDGEPYDEPEAVDSALVPEERAA